MSFAHLERRVDHRALAICCAEEMGGLDLDADLCLEGALLGEVQEERITLAEVGMGLFVDREGRWKGICVLLGGLDGVEWGIGHSYAYMTIETDKPRVWVAENG